MKFEPLVKMADYKNAMSDTGDAMNNALPDTEDTTVCSVTLDGISTRARTDPNPPIASSQMADDNLSMSSPVPSARAYDGDVTSDVFEDPSCTVCIDKFRTYKRATAYCMTCSEYVCHRCRRTCLAHHLVSGRVPGKSTVHRLQQEQVKCQKHTDKPLVGHCEKHDKICCKSCISTSHKSCSIQTLESLLINTDMGKLKENTLSELGKRLKTLRKIHNDLPGKGIALEKHKQDIIKREETLKQELIDSVEHYHREFLERIDETFAAKMNAHKERVSACDKSIGQIMQDIQSIDQPKRACEAPQKKFVHLHAVSRQNLRRYRLVDRDLRKYTADNTAKSELTAALRECLEKILNKCHDLISCLGKVTGDHIADEEIADSCEVRAEMKKLSTHVDDIQLLHSESNASKELEHSATDSDNMSNNTESSVPLDTSTENLNAQLNDLQDQMKNRNSQTAEDTPVLKKTGNREENWFDFTRRNGGIYVDRSKVSATESSALKLKQAKRRNSKHDYSVTCEFETTHSQDIHHRRRHSSGSSGAKRDSKHACTTSTAAESNDSRSTNEEKRRLNRKQNVMASSHLKHEQDICSSRHLSESVEVKMIKQIRKYPCWMQGDEGTHTCITAMELLHDGAILAVDRRNKKVKLFDTRGKSTDAFLALDSKPSGMAKFRENQYLVTLPEERAIQKIEVVHDEFGYEMNKLEKFAVDIDCTDVVTFDDDLVLIGYDNMQASLIVIDQHGETKYAKIDCNGDTFKRPNYVCKSNDLKFLYVTDADKGVYGFEWPNLQQPVFHYNNLDCRCPLGLTINENDQIFVCAQQSKAIVVLSKDGKHQTTVEFDLKNDVYPQCVRYLPHVGEFLVASDNHSYDIIQFKL